jgi:hypothetical protein
VCDGDLRLVARTRNAGAARRAALAADA